MNEPTLTDHYYSKSMVNLEFLFDVAQVGYMLSDCSHHCSKIKSISLLKNPLYTSYSPLPVLNP